MAAFCSSKPVTIDGRDDFAKHFIVSALIAAYADTVLSDVMQLYKEIEGTHRGAAVFRSMTSPPTGRVQLSEKRPVLTEAPRMSCNIGSRQDLRTVT